MSEEEAVVDDNLLSEDAVNDSGGWRDNLPEDMRNEETYKKLEKFVIDDKLDNSKALKSYLNLERGYHDRVALPKADWTDEQLSEFYTKLGRPESFDKYEITRPDMPEGVDYDDNLEKSFLEEAHRLGLNAKQTQGFIDWQSKVLIQGSTNVSVNEAEAKAKAAGQLREEWRGDYDNNLGLARRTAKNVFPKEFIELINEKGIASDPRLVRSLHHLGSLMSESKIGKDEGNLQFGHDSVTAKEEIKSMRKDENHQFHKAYIDDKHPHHKAANEYMDKLYSLAYGDD